MRKSKRSRMGIGAAALVGLCLTALSAAAQQERNVTTSKGNGDTVKVTVSGNVVLDYVYRGREVTAFTDSVGVFGAATSDGENTFEGYVAARLDLELSDKVSALLEFGTKRVDGAAGGINEWGGTAALGLQLREAGITLKDFLMADLSVQFGITNWTFDVRGKGSSFAFDPRHSQSLNRNLNQVGTGANGLNNREVNAARLAMAGTPEELESVGTTFTYSRNNITVDLVLLPAAIEGGEMGSDESLYAIDAWYKWDDKGSKAGVILAQQNLRSAPIGNPSHAHIYTIGLGADAKLMDGNLEIYAEAYFQFGKTGEVGTSDSKANGRAFNLGAQYNIPNNNIWFGASYSLISGDGDTSATDDKTGRFVSYENVHDLMILEDQYFGFDWDSNYQAIKISGGTSLSVGSGKNNLDLMAIIGIARANKDIAYTLGVAAGTTDKKLGNEFDVRANWHLNKQASIGLGFAYLFGSNILEDSMSAAGAPTNRDEKSAFMYTLGLDLRF